MASLSQQMPAVVVEYTSNGKRVQKYFANAYEARRFYAAKLKASKDPKVLKPATGN